MSRVLTITVARKPVAEGSVAKNVLKHGTGALNVDGARLVGRPPSVPMPAFNSPTGYIYGFAAGEGRVGGMSDNSKGRWPANLVLQHKPECRRVGTKRVKSDGHWRPAGSSTRETTYQGGWGDVGEDEGNPLANPDGTETVEAWECVEGCPVVEIDEQSVAMGMHSAGHAREAARTGEALGMFGMPSGTGNRFGDAGGASRFFKQVGGEE